MTKVDDYARALRDREDAEAYLLEHSGLPGPRANLELARAAAEVRPAAELRRWASSATEEFVAFCGVLGLGRLLADGDATMLQELRRHANDPRWRIREAVAMALQRWGEADFDGLAAAMAEWARGSWLERRAAAAALCEPALLTEPRRVQAALGVLETATAAVAAAGPADRRSEEFKALRKGLGYCWSVAVAAAPQIGAPVFEALVERAAASGDRDLRWIARENLRKRRVDPDWAAALLRRLG
ncbi:MAG TPA: hypothetical protein VFZ00_00620 [Solirubrobacter sp.]|nr:hypothetical protein [Solirubrobacter sp.]